MKVLMLFLTSCICPQVGCPVPVPPILLHRRLPAGESIAHCLNYPFVMSSLFQVVTDGLRRADGRYHGRVEGQGQLQPPLHTEIKEGQWLGGAVTSQGEMFDRLKERR